MKQFVIYYDLIQCASTSAFFDTGEKISLRYKNFIVYFHSFGASVTVININKHLVICWEELMMQLKMLEMLLLWLVIKGITLSDEKRIFCYISQAS